MLLSGLIYAATFIWYAILIVDKEEEQLKGLGILNPIFIFASDLTILSLREQSITIGNKESSASFIYSPNVQSVLLLLIRCLVCF